MPVYLLYIAGLSSAYRRLIVVLSSLYRAIDMPFALIIARCGLANGGKMKKQSIMAVPLSCFLIVTATCLLGIVFLGAVCDVTAAG